MAIREKVTSEDAILLLNRALKKDPEAMNQLVFSRVVCNHEMAGDPVIQVGKRLEGGYRLGLLGILNGLFGVDGGTGHGFISVRYNDAGRIESFVMTDFEKIKEQQDGN